MEKKWIQLNGIGFLQSEDKFKTWSYVVAPDSDSQQEKDRDTIAKVKLRYRYKDKKANAILRSLTEIRNQIKAKYPNSQISGDGYGHAFEVFAISVLFEMTYEQAMRNIVWGKYDGKIDAVVVKDEVVYVYQIKMTALHDPNDMRIAQQNMDEFLRDKIISNPNAEDLLDHLKTRVHEITGKQVEYRTVCSNDSGDQNVTPEILFEKFFSNSLLPHERSNIKLKLPIETQQIVLNGITKPYDNYVYLSDKNHNPSTVLVFTNAEKLIKNLQEEGITSKDDRLFYDNIRGKLGDNTSMRDTIANNPELFVMYNNGVSIIGDFTQAGVEFIIENPSFVNGQQTLYNLLRANEDGVDLSKVTVSIFIKTVNSPAERQNIAFYNNTQRPVKEIDLLSLNNDLREIQKYLLEEAYVRNFDDKSYYLKIISNGERGTDTLVKSLFAKKNIISLSEFVRLYCVLENKEKMGDWKSNIGNMIRSQIIDMPFHFKKEKSARVCAIITEFKNFLEQQSEEKRKEYRNADVAFMYLANSFSSKSNKWDIAKSIIEYIDNDIYNEKKSVLASAKLIDLYKSNEILSNIKRAKKALGYK